MMIILRFLFELLISMIITTLLQDQINQMILQFKRLMFRLFHRKKVKTSEDAQCFILGKRETNVMIIDGDGESTFENQNLVIHIQDALPYELPQEVSAFRQQTVSELERRKKEGQTVPWNGNVLSLNKYNVSRTANDEDYCLELSLSKTDYYTVYSTIHNLKNGTPSLREKYIDTFPFENNILYPLPNAVGLCLCVKTKDNKIIFAVRSSNSGFRPGESDVSVVEGLNPQLDIRMHSIDLVSACKRAVFEEIGKVEEDKLDVSVLGLVYDKEYNQWNFIGTAYVDLTQDQLITRRNSGAAGKWELKNLDFIRFHPKDIFQYLSTHTMWDMGVITVYFTLVHSGFSKEKLEQMVEKYLR